jgi:hypothetical protein
LKRGLGAATSHPPQKVESEEEFQRLLVKHDRLTDADGKARPVAQTLE